MLSLLKIRTTAVPNYKTFEIRLLHIDARSANQTPLRISDLKPEFFKPKKDSVGNDYWIHSNTHRSAAATLKFQTLLNDQYANLDLHICFEQGVVTVPPNAHLALEGTHITTTNTEQLRITNHDCVGDPHFQLWNTAGYHLFAKHPNLSQIYSYNIVNNTDKVIRLHFLSVGNNQKYTWSPPRRKLPQPPRDPEVDQDGYVIPTTIASLQAIGLAEVDPFSSPSHTS